MTSPQKCPITLAREETGLTLEDYVRCCGFAPEAPWLDRFRRIEAGDPDPELRELVLLSSRVFGGRVFVEYLWWLVDQHTQKRGSHE